MQLATFGTKTSRWRRRMPLLVSVVLAMGLATPTLAASHAKPADKPADNVVWTAAAGRVADPWNLTMGIVTCDRKNLYFTLNISSIPVASEKGTAGVGLTYEIYRMKWMSGGTAYFADAGIGALGGLLNHGFADGKYLSNGTEALYHGDTGSVQDGLHAVTKVTVPRANVGMTGSGLLTQVTGQALSYTFYQFYQASFAPLPTPQATGTVEDTGGPQKNVKVGPSSCSAVKA